MWGATGGVLTVAELEAGLVDYTNEVVTVSLTVAAVETSDDGTRLFAADSQYGFHVQIAADLGEADFGEGDELLVTGVLGCTLRDGPFVSVDGLDQIVPVEPEAQDDPAASGNP
jgi:hypothetical protein